METVASDRRAALLALRQRKEDEEAGKVPPGQVEVIDALVQRCFRTFDPKTRQMRRTGIADGVSDTAEMAVDGLEATILAEDELKRGEDIDLLNIAPQRPNWDLKRDLKKRLAKLERRDQEAIDMLIRRRIGGQSVTGAVDTALAHLAADEPADDRRAASDEAEAEEQKDSTEYY